MNLLMILPCRAPAFTDEAGILRGDTPASGTTSNFLRLRLTLRDAGLNVSVAARDPSVWPGVAGVISTQRLDWSKYNRAIVHPWEWVPRQASLPDEALPKTALWLHNLISLGSAIDFFRGGGWRLVTPTSFAANTYRAVPRWRDRVSVVPNWFDEAVFRQGPADTARADAPVFLYVGAAGPVQGMVELMEIWSAVSRKHPAAHLRIAGSGAIHSGGRLGSMGIADDDFERNVVDPWLRSLPTPSSARFLGALPPRRLREEMIAARAVIVNPSRETKETFCVSAVEAQACGRPVITVVRGGLRDTLAPRLRRVLPGPGEYARLPEVLLSVCRSPVEWAELGQDSARWIVERFGAAKIERTWLSFVETGQAEPIEGRGDLAAGGIVDDFLRMSGTTGLAMNLVRRLRSVRCPRQGTEAPSGGA